MRIIFLTHYSELFGANRSLLALLSYLQVYQKDTEAKVLLPSEGPLIEELDILKVPHEVIPFGYGHFNKNLNRKGLALERLKYLNSLRFFWRARSVFRGADLIYSNSSVISQGFLMSKLLRKRHVWHVREFGFEDYGLKPLWGSTLQNAMYSRSDRLVFNSFYLKDHFRKLIGEQAGSRAPAVVYNGVFTRREISGKEKGAYLSRSLKICFAGLMTEKKKAIEALRLLLLLKMHGFDCILVVCAAMNTEYAARFKLETDRLDLKGHVHHLGFVNDVRKVLSTCDYLVMPSENEAMGRVTAEAMSAGTPVIGHRSGGTAELYGHMDSGIHYDDIEEVLPLLEKMTSAAYDEMSRKADGLALERYTIETYGEKIYHLCRSLVKK